MKSRTKRFALDVIRVVGELIEQERSERLLKEANELTAIIVASRKTAGGV